MLELRSAGNLEHPGSKLVLTSTCLVDRSDSTKCSNENSHWNNKL